LAVRLNTNTEAPATTITPQSALANIQYKHPLSPLSLLEYALSIS
jgi:hypothetical protein